MVGDKDPPRQIAVPTKLWTEAVIHVAAARERVRVRFLDLSSSVCTLVLYRDWLLCAVTIAVRYQEL